ncbi:hypothetical protein VNO77_28387 [Canavalia gladiata]|uniref:Fe2OG dioxygenase domain-containing protein n=1 Tax=Canavalia gladiata TaxID=3824 RepID=A0AAN9KVJ4_CANGL
MDYEPPFLETYKSLVQKHVGDSKNEYWCSMVESTCEIPSIDLGREECMEEIVKAAKEWGCFEIVNHGISQEVLESMLLEQKKVFYQPFVLKSEQVNSKTYSWGNPFATNLTQLSWSEAFHFPRTQIFKMDQHQTLRSSLEAFATIMFPLAESLTGILASKLNMKSNYFGEHCLPESSFIRLNRYPPCPISSKVHGLIPHHDSTFLTIIYQDQVGGLQLFKDGKWIGVEPSPQALVVNIGDLFQALSNGVYKSIKHRVVASEKVERFSTAFLYCPSEEATIESHNKPAMYRNFTFKEYRQQNKKDIKQSGDKVGLSRFLL